MKKYEIYVQNSIRGIIEAENTSQVFVIIDQKIKSGEYIIDSLEPLNIEIRPADQ